ncbi:MAG: pyridoxal-phosphate dependent enzyme, partial [Planctomycetes bacterium]|nr:pyridoxal-phosphate dependent enzyme [Planctomycetota bacterium]
GVVAQVSDQEILEAKALLGRHGFGCEPASAATVAGLEQLLERKIISPHERVVCVLTGHGLKDPDATVYYHTGINTKQAQPPPAEAVWGRCSNKPRKVADDLEAIVEALGLDKGTLEKSSCTAGYIETAAELPFVEY